MAHSFAGTPMLSRSAVVRPRSNSSRTALGCRLMPTLTGRISCALSNTVNGTPIWCNVRASVSPPMPPPAINTLACVTRLSSFGAA